MRMQSRTSSQILGRTPREMDGRALIRAREHRRKYVMDGDNHDGSVLGRLSLRCQWVWTTDVKLGRLYLKLL